MCLFQRVQRCHVSESGRLAGVSGGRGIRALALSSPWACLLAGGALNLSYAPFSLWWLAWVLLLPLWLASLQPDPRVRLWRGFLFGLGLFGVGLFWLAQTLVAHLGAGWPLAMLATGLLVLLCAPFVAGFAWLAGYFRQRLWIWLLALPLLWWCLEALRFYFLTGLPWLSLGLSQIEGPLAGFVPLVGEKGASALLCFNSVLLLCAVIAFGRGERGSRFWMPVSLLLFTLIAGGLLKTVSWTTTSGPALSIALVQPATPQPEKRQPRFDQRRLKELSMLSEPYLGRTDLIVWPETVVSMEREALTSALAGFDLAAQIRGTGLLLGVFDTQKNRLYNKVMTLGRAPDYLYAKRHLVPLGESVHAGFRFLEDWVPGDTRRGVGRDAQLLTLKGQKLGLSICWEGSFSRDIVPSVRAGAGVLLNLANEAWFWGSVLPAQNLDAFRLRAMETGRPAVRLANLGPGGFIDARGRVTAELVANRPGVLRADVVPRQGRTPFVLVGENRLLAGALALLSILGCAARFQGRAPKASVQAATL